MQGGILVIDNIAPYDPLWPHYAGQVPAGSRAITSSVHACGTSERSTVSHSTNHTPPP